jgi:hypothetical protein
MALWSNSTFLTLERDWEEIVGGRLPKALQNINPNMVEYKGLIGLSPLGLPPLSMRFSATLGKLLHE